MIKKSPHLKVYSLIQKNRMIRKIRIYKLALSVVVDKTTAIYLIVIGLYGLASFFMMNDFINDYYDSFLLWEELAQENFWRVITVLPVPYIIQSFNRPGVIYSSSEYQISILPYSRSKIWFLTALERWIKQFINLLVLGILVLIITPISPLLIAIYIVMVMLINMLMTIPQWKLFQTSAFVKIWWLIVMLIMNMVNFIHMSPILSILFLGLLICLNLVLKQTLFQRVNWSRVTEVCDFQIWTMWFISKVSKVEMKRQRKFSIFKNLLKRKKPFVYQHKSIYKRLWQVYLGKNFQLIFQIMGALFLLLFVFSFKSGLIFHIVLAVVIHIYTSVLRSVYIGRFEADIVQVLPWNLRNFKRSYFKWAIFGSFILLVPVSIFLGMNISIWLPLQLLFYSCTFLYLFHVRMNKAMTILEKKMSSYDLADSIGYLLLIGIGFSWIYKFILLAGLALPFFIKKQSDIY